ncbi:MAG: hypothetical protein MK212_01450 [Saprospiraceae bacterium]|nr:hypothetical protein [Saprospiraceae bacterium]
MKGRKKNKKSFADGLDMLFTQTLEDNLQDNPSMLDVEQPSPKKKIRTKKSTPTKSRKTNRKSFSTDLELFFKESIESNIDGAEVTEIKRNIIKDNKNRKAIGIDVLIQRTAQPTKAEPVKPTTKRVTFVLDKSKIEGLKTVARSQKKYMKNIISDLIEEYLKKNK